MHGLSLAVLSVVERNSTVAVDDPDLPAVPARPGAVHLLDPAGPGGQRRPGRGRAGRPAGRRRPDQRCLHSARLPQPSQGTLTADRRRELVELADRYGFHLILDNPYREQCFAGHEQGLRVFHDSDRAIVVNTFTKTLGPGWRVGWLVLPEHLVAPGAAAAQPPGCPHLDRRPDADRAPRAHRSGVVRRGARPGPRAVRRAGPGPGRCAEHRPAGCLLRHPPRGRAVPVATAGRRHDRRGRPRRPSRRAGRALRAGRVLRVRCRRPGVVPPPAAGGDRTPAELREAVRRLAAAF